MRQKPGNLRDLLLIFLPLLHPGSLLRRHELYAVGVQALRSSTYLSAADASSMIEGRTKHPPTEASEAYLPYTETITCTSCAQSVEKALAEVSPDTYSLFSTGFDSVAFHS